MEFTLEATKMKNFSAVVSSDTYGKLPNPGKRFLLRLAADSVRNVDRQSDEIGMTYARKAMI